MNIQRRIFDSFFVKIFFLLLIFFALLHVAFVQANKDRVALGPSKNRLSRFQYRRTSYLQTRHRIPVVLRKIRIYRAQQPTVTSRFHSFPPIPFPNNHHVLLAGKNNVKNVNRKRENLRQKTGGRRRQTTQNMRLAWKWNRSVAPPKKVVINRRLESMNGLRFPLHRITATSQRSRLETHILYSRTKLFKHILLYRSRNATSPQSAEYNLEDTASPVLVLSNQENLPFLTEQRFHTPPAKRARFNDFSAEDLKEISNFSASSLNFTNNLKASSVDTLVSISNQEESETDSSLPNEILNSRAIFNAPQERISPTSNFSPWWRR